MCLAPSFELQGGGICGELGKRCPEASLRYAHSFLFYLKRAVSYWNIVRKYYSEWSSPKSGPGLIWFICSGLHVWWMAVQIIPRPIPLTFPWLFAESSARQQCLGFLLLRQLTVSTSSPWAFSHHRWCVSCSFKLCREHVWVLEGCSCKTLYRA